MLKNIKWTKLDILFAILAVASTVPAGYLSWKLWGIFIRMQCGVPL